MTDFDKWQIAEARCEDLKAEVARLENAPLCGDHAAAWYTSRDHIKTDSGCLWCDLIARCERAERAQANMRERAAKAIDQHLSPQSEPIYKRIAELPDVVRALPLEDVDE